MQKKQYTTLVAFLILATFITAFGWEFLLSGLLSLDVAHDVATGHTSEMKWMQVLLTGTIATLSVVLVSAVAWPHLTTKERMEKAFRKAHANLERQFEERAVALKRATAERERAQRELLERETQFRNIIEGSIRGLIIHNENGVLFANRAAANILGYETAEALKSLKDVYSIIKPADGKRLAAIVGKVGQTTLAPTFHEIRALRKNGTDVWLSWTCRPINWEGVPAIHSGFVDISSRKQTESALRESEARLAAILNLAPEGILSTDENAVIQVFNRGAEAIFGYRAEEVIGRPLDMLLPDDVRHAHKAHIDAFDKSRETKRDMSERLEVRGLRKDGTQFPAEASVSKIMVNNARIYSAIIRDATERRAAEYAMQAAKTEAELADRAKSSFLASMSHELRTPLNAIIGFSEILSKEMFGPITNKTYHNYAHDILESGQHLLALINDVLDLSKVESGSAELWEEETAISDVVSSVTTMLLPRAYEKNIEMISEIPETLPNILADIRKLKQVLANLISNAVKFTPDNGAIKTTACYSDEDGYAITVRDTGIGIAQEDLKKALAPFQQIDSDLNRKFAGTGLGLPLSQALVALHGGSLEIESEPGKGTAVTVRLPASRAMIGVVHRNDMLAKVAAQREFG